MLKRLNIKRIGGMLAMLMGFVLLCILMSFVLKKSSEQKCKDVKIIIPGANNLVERQDVDAILHKTSGQLLGRNLDQINLYEIENRLDKNPYISKAKVYADIDGIIHIDIQQKEPVLRIFNRFGDDYYIDSEGKKMPISSNFTPRVLVATGNIEERKKHNSDTLSTALVKGLFDIAKYIKNDELWNAQIEQLYVNEAKDIVMVPRVGAQTIVFGDPDSVENKFNKLYIFYKKAMPKVGWDKYKTINLKFANQIVCEKNDTTKMKKPLAIAQPEQQRNIADLIQKEVAKDQQKQTDKKLSN